VYDGDLLVADADGLAKCFLGKYGSFDLSDFKDARDSGKDEDEIIAYINYAGSWSESDFDDCFQGAWDSELAFAENLFDECYLHDVPENLRYYIDYEKFARDLFIGDYYFEDGYVFRRT
jgi:antirestriction protein